MWLTLLTGCGPGPTLSADTASASSLNADEIGLAEATAALPGPDPCATDEGWLLEAPEQDFLPQGGRVEGLRPRCAAAVHAIAGAGGSTLRATLSAWDGDEPARLVGLNLLGEIVAGPVILGAGESLDLSPSQSGELFLRLDPSDPDEDNNTYALDLSCIGGCELRYTRYPIVLMHGMGGTDSFLDLFEYFMSVREELEGEGYLVFTPAVDAFKTSDLRAAQWETHLQGLIDSGAGRRFNLIAHSQGGLDARYLVSVLGWSDRVVSVVTVATPHRGSSVADAIGGVLEDSEVSAWLVDAAMEALVAFVGLGDGADFESQLAALSRPAMEEFNTQVPDVEGVYYASWSASSCAVLDFSCQASSDGEIIDLHFIPSFTLIALVEGPNDGLVPLESGIWGEHMGTLYADHLNELGFFSNELTSPFDHLAFFSGEAQRLAGKGF